MAADSEAAARINLLNPSLFETANKNTERSTLVVDSNSGINNEMNEKDELIKKNGKWMPPIHTLNTKTQKSLDAELFDQLKTPVRSNK